MIVNPVVKTILCKLDNLPANVNQECPCVSRNQWSDIDKIRVDRGIVQEYLNNLISSSDWNKSIISLKETSQQISNACTKVFPIGQTEYIFCFFKNISSHQKGSPSLHFWSRFYLCEQTHEPILSYRNRIIQLLLLKEFGIWIQFSQPFHQFVNISICMRRGTNLPDASSTRKPTYELLQRL